MNEWPKGPLPLMLPAAGYAEGEAKMKQCWADKVSTFDETSISECHAKVGTNSLGLCDKHYEEITGKVVPEDERTAVPVPAVIAVPFGYIPAPIQEVA